MFTQTRGPWSSRLFSVKFKICFRWVLELSGLSNDGFSIIRNRGQFPSISSAVLDLLSQVYGKKTVSLLLCGRRQCHLSCLLTLMQVSMSSKTIPPGQTPGTRHEGSKIPPPRQSLCTKTLPSGQNRESKAPPPGHKVRKFHKYIYKL